MWEAYQLTRPSSKLSRLGLSPVVCGVACRCKAPSLSLSFPERKSDTVLQTHCLAYITRRICCGSVESKSSQVAEVLGYGARLRAAGEQLARGSDFASSLQVECSRGACKRDRILQAPRKWDTPRTLTARSRGEGRRQQQQKQTVCAHLACILQRHCTHSAPALQAAHALDLFANLPVSGFANFSRWPAARRRRHLHRLLSNLATFRALSHSLPSAAGKLVGGNERKGTLLGESRVYNTDGRAAR